MARSRGVRLLSWGLGGIVLGVAFAFLLLNVVARTRPGHEWVLKQTLKALGGVIQGGQLTVGHVEGNLFEGATLYDVALKDTAGRAFIQADSAYAKYDLLTLLSPRIVIDSLTMFKPRIWVFRMPGDSVWNYQAIFADTTTPDTTRPHVERSTVFGYVRMVDALVRVETPFAVDSTLSRREQQRQIRLALSDSSPAVVRRVPKGYVRTVDLKDLQGVLSQVRFAPGSELGTTLHIDRLSGNVYFYRDPIVVRSLRGKVSLPGEEMSSTGYAGYRGLKTGFVEFDIPEATLPATRMAVSGVVRFDNYPEWFDPAQGPMYDVALKGDTVTFKDFQWLYERFPSNLTGRMNLLIETRPDGVMIDTRTARLHAPGTRIDGNFGMILGDTLKFVDVNVDAAPIRTSFIEGMLPDGLPVNGLVLGGVEIRGNNAPAVPHPLTRGTARPDTATRDTTPRRTSSSRR